MPKVSVIVPVYNAEKYVGRCIDSILAQTFTDFELILVDDGSPDNSGKICDEYAEKDSRIKVIHKENGGVSRARNAALDVANGEYAAFCDSDDWWEANLIETAYNALCENKVHAVLFHYFNVTNGVKESKRTFLQGYFSYKTEAEKNAYIINTVLRGKHGGEVWLRFYRLDIIKKHALRFCTECRNFAEDLEFNLRYILYSDSVFCIPDRLYNYNMHEASMMSRSKDVVKLDELNEVSFSFGSEYLRLFTDEKAKRNFAVIHYLIMYNQYMKLIGNPRYKELPERIATIRRKEWFEKHTKSIFKSRSELIGFVGNANARRICLFTRFLIHRNIKRYEFESAFYYKFIHKEV